MSEGIEQQNYKQCLDKKLRKVIEWARERQTKSERGRLLIRIAMAMGLDPDDVVDVTSDWRELEVK